MSLLISELSISFTLPSLCLLLLTNGFLKIVHIDLIHVLLMCIKYFIWNHYKIFILTFKYFLFNHNLHSMPFHTSYRCIEKLMENHALLTCLRDPSGPIHYYFHIIDYILHVVICIYVIILQLPIVTA